MENLIYHLRKTSQQAVAYLYFKLKAFQYIRTLSLRPFSNVCKCHSFLGCTNHDWMNDDFRGNVTEFLKKVDSTYRGIENEDLLRGPVSLLASRCSSALKKLRLPLARTNFRYVNPDVYVEIPVNDLHLLRCVKVLEISGGNPVETFSQIEQLRELKKFTWIMLHALIAILNS